MKHASIIEFCRSMGLLLNTDVNIPEAIDLTKENMENLLYKEVLNEAPKFIAGGHPLYEYLDKHPRYFDFNMVRMIEIGEKTGNLTKNLFYLADVYEEALDQILQRMVDLLEPILLVFIAFVVGFIAFSIIVPIYELSDKLSK